MYEQTEEQKELSKKLDLLREQGLLPKLEDMSEVKRIFESFLIDIKDSNSEEELLHKTANKLKSFNVIEYNG